MRLFDRFRKRVKEVTDETDIEEFTVDSDSEEAKQALARREELCPIS